MRFAMLITAQGAKSQRDLQVKKRKKFSGNMSWRRPTLEQRGPTKRLYL